MSRTEQSPYMESELLVQLSSIIVAGQKKAVTQLNATLIVVYWEVGHHINRHIVKGDRAEYGKQIVVTLSRELVRTHGRGFEVKNLRRMMQFASEFPEKEIVVTLSRQLSWSHLIAILPLKNRELQEFYANRTATEMWSVRELRQNIDRKTYERTALAEMQTGTPSGNVGSTVFKDPYLLDFLQISNTFLEADLEQAILTNLEQFILELGRGFAFVARQKRLIIDGEDHYIDLLFYHRTLRRLVALELKIGKFQASYKGQMELYLKWLDRYEKQPGEEPPIGLILCAESSREQVELLEMHKDGIMVAEYWTQLPSKTELESRLHQAILEARERLAIRQLESDK